jgi:uncharacterized delta-60 repeat protein
MLYPVRDVRSILGASEMKISPIRLRGRRSAWLLGALLLAIGMLLLQFGLAGAALAAAGDLDPSFGTGGKVTTQLMSEGNDIAFQADGKIVVAGGLDARYAVARFRTGGSLDPTFATDGVATGLFRGYGQANAALVQPDGKIVAIGFARVAPFVLARFNADGTLDASFDENGKVQTSLGAKCTSAGALDGALAPDGKIVVAGYACEKFAVARYNTDGTLDTSFSGDGIARTSVQKGLFEGKVAGVVVQPDGKIVIAGSATYYCPPDGECDSDFALFRFDVDGTLDATFGGGDGKVTTKFTSPRCGGPGEARALALQPDGKIVVGGDAGCGDTAGGWGLVFALARYLPDGTLDPAFGGDGRVTGFSWNISYIFGLAIQADGRIVASGWDAMTTGKFAVIRLRSGGHLDKTFGTGGMVLTSKSDGLAEDVAIQTDGKIVATGFTTGKIGGFALVRYLSS